MSRKLAKTSMDNHRHIQKIVTLIAIIDIRNFQLKNYKTRREMKGEINGF